MPSAVVFILDILIVMLIISAWNISDLKSGVEGKSVLVTV